MKTLKQNKNLNFKIHNSLFRQRQLIRWNLIQIEFYLNYTCTVYLLY